MSSWASVEVRPGSALTCTGMPSAAATSRARARRAWLLAAPRCTKRPRSWAPRRWPCAHERGLFVHRGEGSELRRRGGRRVVLEGAGADVDAGPVVEGRRGVAPVGQREEVGGECDRVADLHELEGFVAARGAEVEPLLVKVRRLGALLAGHLVRRPAADHAVDRAAGAVHDEIAAGKQLRIDAADLVERDVALLVTYVDDEADLVVA